MMKRLIFILLILCCIPNAYSHSFDQFKRITLGDKVGLANARTNEIIVTPQFEDIGWADGSLSIVHKVIGYKENGKWGLLSLDNTKITQALFTSIIPFHNNAFIASKRNRASILNRHGVINNKGKTVLSFEYERITPFGELLIVAKKTNNRYGYGLVTLQNKIIIPISHIYISAVNDRLLSVQNEQGMCAIFNGSGVRLSPFAFESIRPFEKNLFELTHFDRKGIINERGVIKLPPVYKKIERIPPNKIRAEAFNKWILLDRNNREINSFYFDHVVPTGNGSLAVQAGTKAGIIKTDETYLNTIENAEIICSKNGLTVVRKKGAFGVLNQQGKQVLPIFYDSIHLQDHLIWARIERANGQSWTTFDLLGEKKNPIGFESFQPIGKNHIAAKRRGKWGILNTYGEESSPFIYDSIINAGHNLFVVSRQGHFGVVDTEGNWVVTPYRDSVHISSHHIFCQQGSEYEVMDHQGTIVYKSYQKVFPAENGFLSKDKNGQYHLYDRLANALTDSPYDSIISLHPGIYLLQQGKDQYLFNTLGKHLKVLKQPIEKVTGVNEGLIGVRIEGKYGFIDTKGQLRIANRYDSIQHFSEGLCAVKLIGKWGFINTEEKIVIQPLYNEVRPFQNGIALVQQEGKYGLITASGATILECTYDRITSKNNYFLLHSGNLIGIADERGRMIRSPQFTHISSIDQQTFLVSKDNQYGAISITGLDIIPVAYEKIIPMKDHFLAMEKSKREDWVLE